jgi:hypothetical protein
VLSITPGPPKYGVHRPWLTKELEDTQSPGPLVVLQRPAENLRGRRAAYLNFHGSSSGKYGGGTLRLDKFVCQLGNGGARISDTPTMLSQSQKMFEECHVRGPRAVIDELTGEFVFPRRFVSK